MLEFLKNHQRVISKDIAHQKFQFFIDLIKTIVKSQAAMETAACIHCTIAFYGLKIFYRIWMNLYRLQSRANVSRTSAPLAQRPKTAEVIYKIALPLQINLC